MADRHFARRWSAAIAVGAAIAVLGVPAPASAVSRAEAIATALVSSPLFVDPSESTAITPAEAASILANIKAAPVPVYVLVVPVVPGDAFGGEDRTMVSAVEAVLGKPGVYVTLGFSGSYLFTEVRDEPAIRDTVDAAQKGANDVPYNSPIVTRIQRFLTLLADPAQAVAAPTPRDDKVAAPAATKPDAGGGQGVPLTALVVIALLAVVLIAARRLVRRRSRAGIAVAGDLSLPPQVFEAARAAAIHELKVSARDALVEFGELLDADDLVPSDGTRPEQEALQEALDAYDAAGRVLDAAAGAADLAGVLVLVDLGRDALDRGHAAANGSPRTARRPVCFFNPLHGRAATTASWQVLVHDKVTVPSCATCAKDVRNLRQPDALRDIPITADGGPGGHRAVSEPPYYERDRQRSVWAATGYGAFGSNLVQSVLESHRYGPSARS